jgi:threonine synthase
VLAKLAERGDLGPEDRVVLYITGDGLKTLDAVRDVVSTYDVEPSVSSFDEVVPVADRQGVGGR